MKISKIILTEDAKNFLERIGDSESLLSSLELHFPGEIITLEILEGFINSKPPEEKQKNLIQGWIIDQSYIPESKKEIKSLTNKTKGFQMLLSSRLEKVTKLILEENPELEISTYDELIFSRGEGAIQAHIISSEGRTYGEGLNQKKYLELWVEEKTGFINAYVSEDNPLFERGFTKNEMVLLSGQAKIQREKRNFFVKQIYCLPPPKLKKGLLEDEELKIAAISDIHFGSIYHNKKKFKELRRWFNKEGIERGLEVLFIPGDGVEGVGIYPNQKQNLTQYAAEEQYRDFFSNLSELPEDLKIVYTPGNHDCVRLSEPQPPISQNLSGDLDGRIHNFSNPTALEIRNYRVQLYHGYSFFNWIEELHLTGTSKENAKWVMEEMVRRRSLGGSLQGIHKISPSFTERLMIDERPNLFLTGHLHSHFVNQEEGTLHVNCSTFQEQTDYQKSEQIIPEVGVLTLIDGRHNSHEKVEF